jgi:hypothetical protein
MSFPDAFFASKPVWQIGIPAEQMAKLDANENLHPVPEEIMLGCASHFALLPSDLTSRIFDRNAALPDMLAGCRADISCQILRASRSIGHRLGLHEPGGSAGDGWRREREVVDGLRQEPRQAAPFTAIASALLSHTVAGLPGTSPQHQHPLTESRQ